MALAAYGVINHIGHHTVFVGFKTTHGSKNPPQHIVIDDITFQGTAHKTGLHTTGLRDQVTTRMGRQGKGGSLFIPTLRIWRLGVGGTSDTRIW